MCISRWICTIAYPRHLDWFAPASRLRLAPPLPASVSRGSDRFRNACAMAQRVWHRRGHRGARRAAPPERRDCEKAMHLLYVTRCDTTGARSARDAARRPPGCSVPPPVPRGVRCCNRRRAHCGHSVAVVPRGRCHPLCSSSRRQHLAAFSGRAGQPRQAGEASAPRSCPPTIVAHHTATGRKHLELGGLR